MIGRWLLCVALAFGAAMPAFAEHPEGSPLNPRQGQNWVKLGSFTGPYGTGDGYTEMTAKTGQPAAMPHGQYLVDFWVVLDQPYDSEEGTLTEEKLFTRIDCPTQSIGDDGSWTGFGPDGSVVSSESSDSKTYSLSKVESGALRALLNAYCD